MNGDTARKETSASKMMSKASQLQQKLGKSVFYIIHSQVNERHFDFWNALPLFITLKKALKENKKLLQLSISERFFDFFSSPNSISCFNGRKGLVHIICMVSYIC